MSADTVECRCTSLDELYRLEAEEYASAHLVRDETDTTRFVERFACPNGRVWELDYAESTERERGQARLRVIG